MSALHSLTDCANYVPHCPTTGESTCKNDLLSTRNLTIVPQSDVLLPCIFNPTLFGSDTTADISVVWSQKNSFYSNLVEITVQGESKFWYNKGGRIITFPERAESGNFSILIRKVNESDLDLYSCKLYEGDSCSIAYQELHLQTGSNILEMYWPLIGGGGAVLILLAVLLCCVMCRKHTAVNASNQPLYANSGFVQRKDTEPSEKEHSCKAHRHCESESRIYANQPNNHGR
ncbi:uncharacterized protein si:dkey-65b12.12 [Trichomycterus rosablanca]|uniref:uncharacterized protein si:dkey-65b12.12 n=1 Tax=Trichomycterus rosablanca TaxID=2290929 RepID=UPI002F35D601